MDPAFESAEAIERMTFSSIRRAAGLSVDDVAREFGVTATEVLEWENDDSRVPKHVIRSLEILRNFGAPAAAEPIEPEFKQEISVSPTRSPNSDVAALSRPAQSAKDALIKSKRRVAGHG